MVLSFLVSYPVFEIDFHMFLEILTIFGCFVNSYPARQHIMRTLMCADEGMEEDR